MLELGKSASIIPPKIDSFGFVVVEGLKVDAPSVPVTPLHLYIWLIFSMSFWEKPSRCPILTFEFVFATIVGWLFFEKALAE